MSSAGRHDDGLEAEFLKGGGEMGALMRAHDWTTSPLGVPAVWPQSLRTVVRLILNTGHPMYVWWGHDLARAIRAEPWGGKVLLIASSGWGREENKQASLDAGFDHHLVKPVEIATFERLLSVRRS